MLLLLLVLVLIVAYLVFYTDLVFYWSDPLNVPASFYTQVKETSVHPDKFLIIGGGFSGIGIAGAFTRHKIPFDMIEKNDALGGNWYNGIYESVHIISSRKTTQFTDFPMPSYYPDFPSAQQMLAYLNAYVDHHGFRSQIQLNMAVESLQVHNEGTENEYTTVVFANQTSANYKGVVVCNGHHWDCRMPSYPNQESFTGEIMHSKQYKKPSTLAGKRVLVIGGGNSACDIASESARFAEEAHISMKRGYWFVPRTLFGIPSAEIVKPYIPIWLQRILIKLLLKICVGSYTDYGLQTPDHNIFEHHPTVNSELLHYLKLGRIKPHTDIKSFLGNKVVEFADGSRAEIDLIICATGYHTSIPVLQKYVTWKNNVPNLITGIMVPKLRNVYYFGFGQPRYGFGPLWTMQASFVATLIRTQAKMKHNLGDLFAKFTWPLQKAKNSLDVLVDPHVEHKKFYIYRALAPWVPSLEWLLYKFV